MPNTILLGGRRIPIIDDSTPADVLYPRGFATGYVPRDLKVDPPEMFVSPSDMTEIPESEWDARFDEQEATGAHLQQIRSVANNGQPIPSLDQNGQGYCWAYSTTMAIIMARAAAGLPYVRLSAHAIGCMVKNFRDEGGWCGLSAKFAREKGVPSVALWPEKSMSRSNDKPEVWQNALLHRPTEEWVDLAKPVYDQNLTQRQLATALLLNQPCPTDYDWWGHSVCALRWIRVERGSWGILIINSWTDSWGELGLQVLRGSKAKPMGALCIRSTTPSLN